MTLAAMRFCSTMLGLISALISVGLPLTVTGVLLAHSSFALGSLFFSTST